MVRKLEKTAISSVFAKGKLQIADRVGTVFSSVRCPASGTLDVGLKVKRLENVNRFRFRWGNRKYNLLRFRFRWGNQKCSLLKIDVQAVGTRKPYHSCPGF